MVKKKILLVDDEPQFLELVKIRLEVNNFGVVTANNGNEALDKLGKEAFDAVLLDIVMPGLDGLETLKMIREKDKKIPVFMLTAYTDKEKFSEARKLSASGFIAKTGELQKEVENMSMILGIAEKYKGNRT